MDRKKIIHLLILISLMFFSLLSYLLYINMFEAEDIVSNPYNMRQWDEEVNVLRGNIYDKNGVLLAKTVKNDDGTLTRIYPKGNLYSHVIGYYSRIYGKSFLERDFDSFLNGKRAFSLNINEIKKGFNLHLTIDDKLQNVAKTALGNRKGTVIAMNPKTGEIYLMVSLPDFNPDSEYLKNNWNSIIESEDSPLINRALSGLYPPGSTFKIVTTAAAYENGYTERIFEDEGMFELDGLKVNNYNNEKLGEINFNEAFKYSSNQVFCSIGAELGEENMLDIVKRFNIGSDIDFEMSTSKSEIGYKKLTNKDCALVAIGQGKLLLTPLNMLLICSTVANDGKLVRPYIVGIAEKDGVVDYSAYTKTICTPISSECANFIKNLMVETVESGTGKNAEISSVQVAGKTGTSENEKEDAHALFVGFAPSDNPEIAVCVVLENDGKSGGSSAAPVAKKIFEAYFINK